MTNRELRVIAKSFNYDSIEQLIEEKCPSECGCTDSLNICGGEYIEDLCHKCWGNADYDRDTKQLKDLQQKMNAKPDAVNHPEHYQGPNECIDVMRAMFGDSAVMAFCKCNAFKYRFRSGMKNGDEDVKKAEWYETYLINMQKENTRDKSSVYF